MKFDVQNPNKQTVLFVIAVCFVGNFLLLLSLSDLFKTNPFKELNPIIAFSMLSSLFVTLMVVIRYMKIKNKKG